MRTERAGCSTSYEDVHRISWIGFRGFFEQDAEGNPLGNKIFAEVLNNDFSLVLNELN
jgi:hypothetical protein